MVSTVEGNRMSVLGASNIYLYACLIRIILIYYDICKVDICVKIGIIKLVQIASLA